MTKSRRDFIKNSSFSGLGFLSGGLASAITPHTSLAATPEIYKRKVDKHSTSRAEHYHYPRQLMVSLLAFDRILERKEKPSGIVT